MCLIHTTIQSSALLLVAATMAFSDAPSIASGGEIYVPQQVGSSHYFAIGKYNSATGTAINTSLVTGFSDPTSDIAVSGSHLYVSTYAANGTIGEYDATTGAVINAALISGLNYPNGFAISGSSLFVYPGSGHNVNQYDANTGAQTNSFPVTGVINEFSGIAVSGNHLFIINSFDKTIGEYDATTGAPLDVIATGLTNPQRLAVSGANLYVISYEANSKVWEYNTTSGSVVTPALITGLSYPTGIAVSGSKLFVSSTNTIGEYDAATGAVDNAALITGVTPFGVAVVPEPSSLALAALGLAGLAVWRRRRCNVPLDSLPR